LRDGEMASSGQTPVTYIYYIIINQGGVVARRKHAVSLLLYADVLSAVLWYRSKSDRLLGDKGRRVGD